ncbi:Major facilitator superfamily domain-containing protein 10 [Trichostrongylus colubriformis]|uniref:Major facilitator superfamily domain-containing protein 10 n=1 Tax=Trichostrongylus colubriformis TaxID=6319 RepID=A0AAN8FQ77_TRICO
MVLTALYREWGRTSLISKVAMYKLARQSIRDSVKSAINCSTALREIECLTGPWIWLRAETFTVFVISRIIGGLSKANVNVATAIVSDVFKPEDNPKGMALIGISYSVGFLIGPMFGAYFSTIAPKDFPHSSPAIFSIVLTVIEFMLIAFCLPETLKFEERVNDQKSIPLYFDHSIYRRKSRMLVGELISSFPPLNAFKFSAVDAPIKKKHEMQRIGVIYFIYLFLYAGLEFTLPFLTHLRFNFDSMQQGKIYLFTGLLMLPIQGYVVRRTSMIKQKRVAEIGMMFVVPAFLIIAQATNQFLLYLGLFFISDGGQLIDIFGDSSESIGR